MNGPCITPDDVRARLPFVAAVAGDAVRLTERAADADRAYREERRRAVPSQAALNERAVELRRLRDEILACTAELTQVGAADHEAASGTVDFPGEVHGAPVLLCWKLGEERVDHFHRRGEAHAARRPIPAAVPVHAG